MSWFRRREKAHPGGGAPTAPDVKAVERHFTDFAETRRGVEAYVEPSTNITATTLVLIAHDGEWTRRAVPSRDAAFTLARRMALPVYDVNQTGYPGRMREWTSRQRRRDG